jgi:hypothetical protein
VQEEETAREDGNPLSGDACVNRRLEGLTSPMVSEQGGFHKGRWPSKRLMTLLDVLQRVDVVKDE